MPQLDRLGLRENPFKKNTEQRYFYADQSRSQILESTEHLIDYSSNFQVILGEAGVGKSHFMETLAQRVDNNWRIAKVNNAEQYDTISLIQAILDAFGTTDSGHRELLEALETQLAEINQLGFKPVLLVDSAQALSIDSLRFLIQLSQQKQDEEPYINVVLFATDEVSDSLQSPELRSFREFIHIATLSRFDKEGVSGFLRHKMAVAGYDRESPFTPRIIDSIFTDSNGLPEKINFFADKFLASSGKADNYITADTPRTETSTDTFNFDVSLDSHVEEIPVIQTKDIISPRQNESLSEQIESDVFEDNRTDRAAEQLNRLAEKFEEIEQLGEQPVDSFFGERGQENTVQTSDSSLDEVQSESDFFDELSNEQINDKSDDNLNSDYANNFDNDFDSELDDDFDEKKAPSVLPKFIIPVFVIGLLIVAIIVISSVFEKPEQNDVQTGAQEEIELLPLELPPQGSVIVQDVANQNQAKQKSLPTQENIPAAKLPEVMIDGQNKGIETKSQKAVSELEVVESVEAVNSNIETKESSLAVLPPSDIKKPLPAQAPILKGVNPEPVIGSNSRQYITIMGTGLKKDDTLIVDWAGNKKEFSARKTPDQWQFVNKKKVKLYLSTGIESQQWQVVARNSSGAESKRVTFDVVRPFISKMSIQRILPAPFIGSDKRQAVIIKGQGFSKQTVLELKWDKNKKHFSSRLTPSQFEFVSANQLKLFIATGTKERKWNILATNPSGGSSSSSFSVVKKSDKQSITTSTLDKESDSLIKDESWLKKQPNTHYTIQLFGSYNKQAIDDLVTKHSLKGDILRFKTQKEGKSWYTMTYGNYASKKNANYAVASLAPALTNPTPWVRSLGSIKEKLQPGETTAEKPVAKASVKSSAVKKTSQSINSDKLTTKPSTSDLTFKIRNSDGSVKAKDEAWIWTQNPASYTVQLIALSSKSGVEAYIGKYQISSEAVYFKTFRNNKLLYIILYGQFSDKKQAVQASEKLSAKIKGSKPWIRSFSVIHEMMSSR